MFFQYDTFLATNILFLVVVVVFVTACNFRKLYHMKEIAN